MSGRSCEKFLVRRRRQGGIRELGVAIGEACQRRIQGLEERAERAAQTRGWGNEEQYDPTRGRIPADEARLEQVREVEGKEAYRERFRRVVKLRKLGGRLVS